MMGIGLYANYTPRLLTVPLLAALPLQRDASRVVDLDPCLEVIKAKKAELREVYKARGEEPWGW